MLLTNAPRNPGRASTSLYGSSVGASGISDGKANTSPRVLKETDNVTSNVATVHRTSRASGIQVTSLRSHDGAHKSHRRFEATKDKVAGACGYCAGEGRDREHRRRTARRVRRSPERPQADIERLPGTHLLTRSHEGLHPQPQTASLATSASRVLNGSQDLADGNSIFRAPLGVRQHDEPV